MSETTHTPGPWILKERSERDGIAIDVVSGARVIAPGVAAAPSHYGETEGYANARLIAASPDLLEACKKAMLECCDLIATDAGNAIEAAIARAVGRS